MKTGTVVFRVIVCIWLFGLTVGVLGILWNQYQIKSLQYQSYQITSGLSGIMFNELDLKHSQEDVKIIRDAGRKILACKDWNDLASLE